MADFEVPEQVDHISDSSDKSSQAQTQDVETGSRDTDNIHQGEHVPDASKTETEPKHSAGTNESVIDDLLTNDANEQQPEETAEDARLGSSDQLSSQPDLVLTEATAQNAIGVGANATANVSKQTTPSAAGKTAATGTGTEGKTGAANTTAGETINGSNAATADTSAAELGLETEVETEIEPEAEISAEEPEPETTELTSDLTETVAPPEAISDFIVREPIVEAALDAPTAELGPITNLQQGPRIERDNDPAHERIELAIEPEPGLVIPKISTLDLSALEDQSISLDINLVGENNADSMKITISGIPEGATLSAGTEINPGVWRMPANQLDDLRLHLPEDFSGEFKLDVDLTGVRGSSVESSTNSFLVDVQGVADAPSLVVKTVTGTEDQAVDLNISAALSDASEILSVEVSQLPTGATLSAGTEIDGVWTLTGSELEGLQLHLPANLSGEFNLSVKATSSEGGSALSVNKFLQVNVDAQADAPTLSISPATGTEDQAVDLNISAALSDASEILSVEVSQLPTGATLSAGTEIDGVWTLTGSELEGLQLHLPANLSGEFNLSVKATSSEGGSALSVNKFLQVNVDAQADAPTLSISPATGTEDQAVDLNISAALGDASETLTVTIADVPTGATLSAGENNGDGSWTLSGTDLTGLKLNLPTHYSGSINLLVTATSTESANESASVNKTLGVTVDPVADAPNLTTGNVSGSQADSIPLIVSSDLVDSSETLSITISGVPTGASLSAGIDNGDGTWDLTPAQLDNLSYQHAGSPGVVNLSITATATESDGSTADTTSNLFVTVTSAGETFTGTDEKDVHTGTEYNDELHGAGGKDTLRGAGGDDSIYGDSGDDKLYGDAGDDVIEGGSGKDKLYGGEGDDTLEGGTGDDKLYGDAGDDTLKGGDGKDKLYGGEGDDTLEGGAGDDTLKGDAGDDTLKGGDGKDKLYGGEGDDTLEGGADKDTLKGDAGSDILKGEAGDDKLYGGEGDDTLEGGAGDDTLKGDQGDDLFIFNLGDGNDSVNGGEGGGWTDTIRLQGVTDGPVAEITQNNDWTIELHNKSAQYTIDEENQTIEFQGGEGRGTITVGDGSEIEFNQIERIEW